MFISSPCAVHPQPGINLPIKLNLPQDASGPEDFACDPKDKVCYTGVNDGRILKFSNEHFSEFATTSPLRTKEKCDGITLTNVQAECGRPLGLDFDRRHRELYITDAFYGLLKVGINGGLATQLAAGVDGQNFSFADSVAVDENYGDAYFVDSGAIFRTLNVTLIVQSGDTSGRLLKYEAATGQVRVLLNGLSGPAGMAMSRDRYGTFIMISEYIARKVIKYYITGPKANTTATVLDNLEGYPDNVKRAATKGFWVAVNIPKPQQQQQQPQQPLPRTDSIAVHFDMNGKILNTRNLTNGFPNSLSVYFEWLGKAYAGSSVQPVGAKWILPCLPTKSSQSTLAGTSGVQSALVVVDNTMELHGALKRRRDNRVDATRLRRKISSRFLAVFAKDAAFLSPRHTRNSKTTALRSENRRSASRLPEKEERCYPTRGSAEENGKVAAGAGGGNHAGVNCKRKMLPEITVTSLGPANR
nr:protein STRICTOSIDINE SYNTHASE-LIKE 11-like [Ipomoea batatas]